ncbi:DUF4290 domain-containing protein [Flavobacteriaceae bacterium]|nr:DUF4290 domain-containing protein [Flavobacteriaceae bacterium]MDA9276691.1 DUF4290 domain-containing protein [Flavobacteriaceae bacterium]MDB3874008.1 DUF4290 domain-containing protein [Flavobacteriaceae bacterium]MDC0879694.1 DUF4290 domain-containing protein [Flavobacteriaceae bacterium]MDC6462288.1 DUF4290 domain-containing protein [Flavobacteriaceae bacterium]|tara:strand:+ start:467 stop:1108 length:642 start_codon:yes stop_codon:yes gene_type:complete
MNSLEYNTERTKLIIPEYGRHVHQMIDQAVALKDKDERNKMAKAIIGVMGNLNPHLRDVPDFKHKLWAQLFIMSNFELDADSPFEKPSKEVYVNAKPNKLEYPQSFPKYRFYGNNIKKMIDIAMSWEEGDLKDKLIANIANHMKKCFLNWNKDTVEDKVIFDHLADLSNGTLKVPESKLPLTESSEFLKNRVKTNNNYKTTNNKNRKKPKRRY